MTTILDWHRISEYHYRARNHSHDYVIIGRGEDPAHAWLAIPSDPHQGWRTEASLTAAMTVCEGWNSALSERLWEAGR
jgi:hypothetical protein